MAINDYIIDDPMNFFHSKFLSKNLGEGVISHKSKIFYPTLRLFAVGHDKHMQESGKDYYFKYEPSPRGTSVYIGCVCGAEVNITDYRLKES